MKYKTSPRVLYNVKDRSYCVDDIFITYDSLNPIFEMSIYTLCDMHDVKNIYKLEQVLDKSAVVKVSKIQERIPPRTKADRFENILTEIVVNSSFSKVLVGSTSGGKYPFETMLSLNKKERVGPNGGRDCGYSNISIYMSKKDIEEGDSDILEFKKLFTDLCLKLNAFTGYCTEHSMLAQGSIYLALSVKNACNRKTSPNYDLELNDIFWLNYYGPGYVVFWGKDKIIALKKEYNCTHDANGGIVIQTTEKPMFADDSIDKISDYGFKQSMYEILGHNTFMHETHQPGKRGENVPTLECMRNLV